MCNLSKRIAREAQKEQLLQMVNSLMETTKNSFAVVAEMLRLPAEDVDVCKKSWIFSKPKGSTQVLGATFCTKKTAPDITGAVE